MQITRKMRQISVTGGDIFPKKGTRSILLFFFKLFLYFITGTADAFLTDFTDSFVTSFECLSIFFTRFGKLHHDKHTAPLLTRSNIVRIDCIFVKGIFCNPPC